jgi:hypothetical protein
MSTKYNLKKKAILARIKSLEDSIAKGREYLETGEHANWHGFGPIFGDNLRTGHVRPPHKDWIKNVFIPKREKALKKAEDKLEKFD